LSLRIDRQTLAGIRSGRFPESGNILLGLYESKINIYVFSGAQLFRVHENMPFLLILSTADACTFRKMAKLSAFGQLLLPG